MSRWPAVLLLLVAGCGGATQPSPSSPLLARPRPPAASCHLDGAGLSAGPDHGCTPGAWIADPNTAWSHVCRAGYNRRPPLSVTGPLKARGLRLYGLPRSAGATTESDHLFPVWAGGKTVIANLWPEPNYAHPPDSYTHNPKDALEFAIYKLTCQGHKLTVPQARAVFERDWRQTYQQYVGPLPQGTG